MTFAVILAICISAGSCCCAAATPLAAGKRGWQPQATTTESAPDFEQAQTLLTAAFWMLWLAFMFALSGGLMVIGSLKDFGVREGGLSEAEAEVLGLLAVFNSLGRIFWGFISQRWMCQPDRVDSRMARRCSWML